MMMSFFDVFFGEAKPEGKLQFILPSSMIAVKHQKEDLPYDSKYPLFLFIWTLLSIGRYILIR